MEDTLRALMATVALVVACSACMTTVQPRSGEVVGVGELSWGGYAPISTVGSGQLRAVGRVREGGQTRALSLGGTITSVLDANGGPPPPLSFEGSFRVGVIPRCELGAFGGIFRIGAEARCGLLSQREGAPLAAALSLGGAAAPFFDLKGPWLRGGVDLSRRFDNGMAALLNVALSRGPEHRFALEQVPVDFWDVPPDPNVADDPGASFEIEREETRLAVSLGFGVGDEVATFVIALVPYFVLDDGPLGAFECHRCETVAPVALEERFGLTLLLGVIPAL